MNTTSKIVIPFVLSVALSNCSESNFKSGNLPKPTKKQNFFSFKSWGSVALLCATLLASLGCRDRTNSSSDTKYALSRAAYIDRSLARDIPSGNIRACIAVVDVLRGEEATAAKWFSSVSRDLQQSLLAWAALIPKGSRYGPREPLRVDIVTDQNFCTDSDINVIIALHNGDGWRRACEFYTYDGPCRSYAHPPARRISINLSPEQKLYNGMPTMLHEIGHLFGLGDLYEAAGYQRNIGKHAAAVMGGDSATLTTEDQVGLLAVLHYLDTGKRECGDGRVPHQATENVADNVFCVPASTAGVTNSAAVAFDFESCVLNSRLQL